MGLEGVRLVVLLSASGSGPLGYEVKQTFVVKPQIAVIARRLGLRESSALVAGSSLNP